MSDPIPFKPDPFSMADLNYQKGKQQHILSSVKSAGAEMTDARLKQACAEMESLFVSYLLKTMRATIQKSGFISGGRAEEIYTSMMDTEISRKISVHRGLGLSDLLFEQLSGYRNKENVKISKGLNNLADKINVEPSVGVAESDTPPSKKIGNDP